MISRWIPTHFLAIGPAPHRSACPHLPVESCDPSGAEGLERPVDFLLDSVASQKDLGINFKILNYLHKISWAFSLYKLTGFNLYTFLMRGVIDSNPVGSDNADFPKFPLNNLHVHVVQIWCEKMPDFQCPNVWLTICLLLF